MNVLTHSDVELQSSFQAAYLVFIHGHFCLRLIHFKDLVLDPCQRNLGKKWRLWFWLRNVKITLDLETQYILTEVTSLMGESLKNYSQQSYCRHECEDFIKSVGGSVGMARWRATLLVQW